MNNDIQDIEQEDIEIGKYVYTILISQPTLLWSWGYQSPVVVRLGLRFKVNGFLLKGSVQVLYNEGLDLFDLTFYTKDMQIRNTLEGIYVDQLVEVIDDQVERVNNYSDRVNQEYNFLNNEK